MDIAEQIRRAAARHPGAIAAMCGERQMTLAALDERSTRLANALLTRGIAPGRRIATWLENSIACLEIDFALAKAGIVRVPINPRATAAEAATILADVEADALFFGPAHAAAIAALDASVWRIGVDGASGGESSDDLIASGAPAPLATGGDGGRLHSIFFTSGSSGRPKGCMLTHDAIFQVACNVLLEIGPAAPGEKLLLLQPLSHGAAYFVLPYIMRGCTVVVMPRFDADEALTLMHRLAIETVRIVPTMLQRMLHSPAIARDFPRLRQILYAGSAVPAAVLRAAIERFGPRLSQQYGQSEAPSTIALLPREDHTLANLERGILASAGRPWPTVELGIVDEDDRPLPPGTPGEVVVRAPHCMSGYWKRPETTAHALRGGWLHTNDLGRLDHDGRLYLLGRRDEMIISGGYNIAPREVEDALHRHPAVLEAAVIAEPDDEWGQAVVAYAVVRDRAIDADALIEYVRPLLGYKRPRRVHLLDELPKSPNGKIRKTALRPPRSGG